MGDGRLLDEAQLAALIQRTAAKDRAAFRALYDATCGRMMAVALRLLGRRDLAEEALQDAYLAIWNQAGRFDPARGSARGWIVTIVRRRAIDRLRASPWLQREIPETAEVEARIDSLPDTLTLRQCLERLEERTRHAICLAYLYGMTHEELSGRTGVPLGTMKSRLRRGLAALKACLDL